MMRNFLETYGQQLARQALNSRRFAPLMDVMLERNSPDPQRSGPAAIVWRMALIEIAGALNAIQEKKLATFSPVPPTREAILYASITDPEKYQALSEQTLVAFKALNASALRGLTFGDASARQTEEKKEPLEIKIVGMPPRETASVIARDERGEMSGSTQVERDL